MKFIKFPPMSFVKKWKPRKRSSPSMAQQAVRGGIAKISRIEVQRAVQVNSGILMKLIPAVRNL